MFITIFQKTFIIWIYFSKIARCKLHHKSKQLWKSPFFYVNRDVFRMTKIISNLFPKTYFACDYFVHCNSKLRYFAKSVCVFSSILIFCLCIYTKNCRFSYVNLIVCRMCIFLSVHFRTCRKILHSFPQRVKNNAKFFRKFWKCKKHKHICVSHFFTLKNSLRRKFSASCKLSC